MRPLLSGLSLIVFAMPAFAHDFWLQPLTFHTKPGLPLPITLQLGHGRDRQRWGGGAERVLLLASLGPTGRVDLRDALRPPGSDVDLAPAFARPGAYVVVMQTTHAQSELPGIRFNDYLKAEGLTPALAARAQAGTTARPGREIYSRRAKTLIQVGATSGADRRRYTHPVGLSLEIVPDRDPFVLGVSRMLPVHVLYEGRRLAGATVMLTSLEFDSRPLETAVTDAKGRASFRLPPVGDWLVNVIWTKPITDPRGDFDTTFSSLTFGYDPAQRGR